MRTSGSPDFASRWKITASDGLASTKTPRNIASACYDLILRIITTRRRPAPARYASARWRRHHGVEVAGVVAGARGDAPVGIAECVSGFLHRIDQFWIKMGRRLAPD